MKTSITAFIVDASVLAKVILDEPESEAVWQRVEKVSRAVPLLAPPLVQQELENIAVTMARRGSRASASELRAMVMEGLDLVTLVQEAPDPLPLALKHRLSAYDATYLALTLDSGSGARLWTFDADLAAAASAEGVLAREDPIPPPPRFVRGWDVP